MLTREEYEALSARIQGGDLIGKVQPTPELERQLSSTYAMLTANRNRLAGSSTGISMPNINLVGIAMIVGAGYLAYKALS